VAHRCWAGEQEAISHADALRMLDELAADGRLAPANIAALRTALHR
jgi:hypothetical protein